MGGAREGKERDNIHIYTHLIVSNIVYDTGTIYEENTLHEGNVLPHLRLSRNRCGLATLP